MLILFLPKSQMAIKWFLSLTSRHKKRGTFFLLFSEVFDYLTNQIREAHDFTRERSWLILWLVLMKVSKFQKTNYKLKRYFMSLKINYVVMIIVLFAVSSFLFVGFQLAKIWIFTSIVQILFDSLEKSHSVALEK